MILSATNRLFSLFRFTSIAILFGTAFHSYALRKSTIYFEPLMGYEELPNLQVNAIHQDKYGLTWVGTNDGLVCYNGSEYITYKYSSQNPESISSKRITAIGECPTDGDLWISTYDGLNRFNREENTFTRFPLRNESGEPLTPGGQVIRFDSKGNVMLATIIGMPIFICETEKWDLTYTSYGKFDTFVKGIHKVGNDEFLLATTSGFFELDLKTQSLALLPNSPRHEDGSLMEGRCMLLDSNKRLWFGTINEGFFVYNENGEALSFPVSDKDITPASLGTIRYLKEDINHNIWIGSVFEGIYVLDHHGEEIWHYAYGTDSAQTLPGRIQTAMTSTQDRQILFGTQTAGVYRFNPNRHEFQFYQRSKSNGHGLMVSPIQLAVEDPNGEVWMNDGTRKLSRFNPDTKTFVSWPSKDFPLAKMKDNIHSWAIDSKNCMWISSRKRGLFCWKIDQNILEKIEFRALNFEPNPLLLRAKLYTDSKGYVWLLGRGILRFNPMDKTMKLIGKSDRIVSKSLAATTVYENQLGDLWFGTNGNGFYYYSGEEEDIKEGYLPSVNPELLKDTNITSLYQQGENYLWISSESGLGRFNLKLNKFENPEYIEPLLSTPIYGMQCDNKGSLWMLTGKGLSKVEITSETIRDYDKSDGLQASDFVGKPFLKIAKSRFIIGGRDGFSMFNPNHIHYHKTPSHVNITKIEATKEDREKSEEFKLATQPYLTKSITLPYDHNFLNINFSNIALGNPSDIIYSYRLLGLSDEWNQVKNTQASFARLPPGDYTFEVTSTNSDQLWINKVTKLQISILNPFYMTWWFKASVIVIVIILFLLAVKYRTFKVNAINHRLAKQVFRRTRDLEETRNEAIVARKDAEEADRAKSIFLATVSHEIRTPMNGVLGMSNLLRKTPLDSSQKQFVEAIDQSGSSLMHIINDILDFSKLEAGKFEIHPHELNTHVYLHHLMRMFKPEALSHGLSLEGEIENSVPDFFYADEHRLGQVMANLLSNAIKFTPKGTIKVRVSTIPPRDLYRLTRLPIHQEADPKILEYGKRLYFSVTDTGIGIDTKDNDKLFKSFSQVDDTVDRKFGGTGIGLAISKHLVNLMGGEIDFKSEKDVGSTFVFSIQTQEISNPTPNEVKENNEVDSAFPSFTDHDRVSKVLIVDDNFINCTVAEGLVNHLGYLTKSVESGEEAFELLKEDPHDLVLMDIQMPKMNGYETTRLIRSNLSSENQPVILAITAYVVNDIEKKCAESGLDGIITKPVTVESLIQAFKQHNLVTLGTPATD